MSIGQYFDLIHMFEKIVDKRGIMNTNMVFWVIMLIGETSASSALFIFTPVINAFFIINKFEIYNYHHKMA